MGTYGPPAPPAMRGADASPLSAVDARVWGPVPPAAPRPCPPPPPPGYNGSIFSHLTHEETAPAGVPAGLHDEAVVGLHRAAPLAEGRRYSPSRDDYGASGVPSARRSPSRDDYEAVRSYRGPSRDASEPYHRMPAASVSQMTDAPLQPAAIGSVQLFRPDPLPPLPYVQPPQPYLAHPADPSIPPPPQSHAAHRHTTSQHEMQNTIARIEGKMSHLIEEARSATASAASYEAPMYRDPYRAAAPLPATRAPPPPPRPPKTDTEAVFAPPSHAVQSNAVQSHASHHDSHRSTAPSNPPSQQSVHKSPRALASNPPSVQGSQKSGQSLHSQPASQPASAFHDDFRSQMLKEATQEYSDSSDIPHETGGIRLGANATQPLIGLADVASAPPAVAPLKSHVSHASHASHVDPPKRRKKPVGSHPSPLSLPQTDHSQVSSQPPALPAEAGGESASGRMLDAPVRDISSDGMVALAPKNTMEYMSGGSSQQQQPSPAIQPASGVVNVQHDALTKMQTHFHAVPQTQQEQNARLANEIVDGSPARDASGSGSARRSVPRGASGVPHNRSVRWRVNVNEARSGMASSPPRSAAPAGFAPVPAAVPPAPPAPHYATPRAHTTAPVAPTTRSLAQAATGLAPPYEPGPFRVPGGGGMPGPNPPSQPAAPDAAHTTPGGSPLPGLRAVVASLTARNAASPQGALNSLNAPIHRSAALSSMAEFAANRLAPPQHQNYASDGPAPHPASPHALSPPYPDPEPTSRQDNHVSSGQRLV